jgi:signal transduction histidine kinase
MKCIIFLITLCFGVQLSAQNQDADIQSKIDFFNSKIQQTERGERLTWLDSLTKITYLNPKLGYDVALRQTIDLAIDLDSLNFAAKKVADLIGFQNNFLGKPKEGLKLFKAFGEKLNKGADFGAIGRMYLNAADSYYYTGDIGTSFEYYALTKTYAAKAKDQQLLGWATMYTGYNESEIGKFAEASQSLKEAANIFTKLKDTTNMLGAKNALAVLYSRNAFYIEAEKERKESILLIGKTNRYRALTNLYYNAAEDHKRTGDFKEQLVNVKAAFLANSKTSNAFLVKQLISAYCKNDSINQAEKCFEDLEVLYVKDKSEDLKEQIVKAKRALSFTKGDYKNAIKYSSEFLSMRQNKKTHLGDIVAAEQFLAEAYRASGDDISYKKHLLKYYTLKDSLSNIQNVKSLAYYQTLYETEKRDLEIQNQKSNISVLNLENNVLNLNNRNQNQLLVFGYLGLLFLFGGIIVYRSFLNAKKREQTQQEFSQELITTQEYERTRIARDLHDGIGQQIILIKMKAFKAGNKEISDMACDALEEVRSISRDLYPVTLEKLGLTNSIEQLLLDLGKNTDLFVASDIDDVNTSFNEIESLNFYRFIQESVNNVLKHAQANTLVVNILKKSDGVKILIKDNGLGFEANKNSVQNSIGLKTMAERIAMLEGSFAIKSKREEGTSILVQIPV